MSFFVEFIDAEVTLIAGVWACVVAWTHPATRDTASPDRPGRDWKVEWCIGPLIIVFAIAEAAMKLV